MNENERLKQSARLHHAAMDHADDALLARHKGDKEGYYGFTEEAYLKEAEAAEMIRHDLSHQMYAILHRSAATLAFRCGKFREAEQFVIHGLVADPDVKLREELHNLLIDVRFYSWLGSSLPPASNNELVMTLTGTEADSGAIEVASFASRISSCESLIRNTIGDVQQFPFRDIRKLDANYRILTAPPSKGSFKINIQLIEVGQQSLPGFDVVEKVYDKVMASFKTLENGDTTALEASFNEDEYFHSFMGLARKLAPDGKRVNAFSLEADVKGARDIIVFERTTEDIDSIYSPPERTNKEYQLSEETVTLVGTVRAANGTVDTDQVIFDDDDGKRWYITVPDELREKLGEKVARPYFELRAKVEGYHRYVEKRRDRLQLKDISDIDQNPSDQNQERLL